MSRKHAYPINRYSTGVEDAGKYAEKTGHAVEPFGFDYSRCEADEARVKIVHFNTKDRDTPALKDPTNCVIKFPGVNNCKRAWITQAEIRHNQYNVNEYNNILVFTEYTAPGPSATYTITITIGNYTGTTLATAIQGAFNSALGGGVATATFSTANNTFTFARVDVPGNTIGFPFLTNPLNVTAPANELIGLKSYLNYTATNGGSSIVSDTGTALTGPMYLLLAIRELEQDTTSNYSTAFAKIQCKTAPESVLFYSDSSDSGSSGKYFASMPQKFGLLSVKLVNPDGKAYLGRGCDFSFSVAFESCGG